MIGAQYLTRRSLLASSGVAAALLLPGCAPESSEPDETKSVALIMMLADIAIPTTDTLGAGGAETAKWVYQSLARGMRDGSLDTIVALEKELDLAVPGKGFRRAPKPHQVAALESLDRFVNGGKGAVLSPWATVKSLIFRAYYTSEVGASQELRYELVPGRFDADLPVKPGDRAWSTDANARNLDR